MLVGLILAYLGLWTANRSQVRVAGWSMAPTLWPDDRLLTVPVPGPLVRRALRAGHVVVVAAPDAPAGQDHLVVKRIRTIDRRGIDVRGDDPAHSTDSRTWGPLPPAAIRAVVVARWPDLRTALHRPPGDQ
jgi:nickel-type superoxide dismutase maturation protease